MPQLIVPAPTGDTAMVIADKTRALPANQGLNDWDMWQKIDAEIASASSASTLRAVGSFKTGNGGNSHGSK
jgi:hypothetical protein